MANHQTKKIQHRAAIILLVTGMICVTGPAFGAGAESGAKTSAAPAAGGGAEVHSAPAAVSEAPAAERSAPAPSAPAPAHVQTPPPVVSQSPSPGGEGNDLVRRTPPPTGVVGRQAPPPVQTVPTPQPTATPQAQQTDTEHRNGEHRDHNHDGKDGILPGSYFGQAYVDPGWPFYGWDNNGDYNNYNNGNNYTPSATPNGDYTPANNAPAAAQTQAPAAVPAQPAATVTAAGVQALLSNAVDKSPAMISANSRVQTAQSAFDTERERVLAALRKSPEYQQALGRRRAASHDVNTARAAAGQTTNDTVMNAAIAKLEAGDDVTKMEEQAIAGDPAAAAAKGRLEQATIDRDALRSQLMSQSATH